MGGRSDLGNSRDLEMIMGNDRQWFWTKLVGSAMTLFILVSSCIGAANMYFDLKRDVVRNESTLVEHKTIDDKKWNEVWEDVDENTDNIHLLEKNSAVAEAHYQSIKSELAEIKLMLKNLERSE